MQSRINTPQSDIHLQIALSRLQRQSDKTIVSDLIGKRVIVNGHYHGKVVAMNESPYGAFPASHYPVIVELDVDFHDKLHQKHAFKLSDLQLIES